MIHQTTLMLLGIKPVPPGWYRREIRGARIHKGACFKDSNVKRYVNLSDDQKEILDKNIRAALVGRWEMNALDLYDEFVEKQERDGIELIPLDDEGELIAALTFRDIVNKIRNPNPSRRPRGYLNDTILKKTDEGMSTIEIARDMSISLDCVRKYLRKNGLSDPDSHFQKYFFDDITGSKIFEFATQGQAFSCRNACYKHNTESKKYSASVKQEGDVFICEVRVRQNKQEPK